MVKKVLLVIHNLNIGGAQKSLISFLKCLESPEIMGDYSIDLIALNPTGDFITELPSTVKLLKTDNTLRWMGTRFSFRLLNEAFSWRALYGEGCWVIRKFLGLFCSRWNTPQKVWKCWQHLVTSNSDSYDVAISYMDGISNYYVIDKVNARKKNTMGTF